MNFPRVAVARRRGLLAEMAGPHYRALAAQLRRMTAAPGACGEAARACLAWLARHGELLLELPRLEAGWPKIEVALVLDHPGVGRLRLAWRDSGPPLVGAAVDSPLVAAAMVEVFSQAVLAARAADIRDPTRQHRAHSGARRRRREPAES